MISMLFNEIFYKPILNGLVFLISFLPNHDIGLAVIILTILVRLIILPLSHRATKTQLKIKELEPHIKDIKEKFKKDNQEQAKRIMDLYKRHGVSPFSSLIVFIIQIPLIIALYRVFASGASFNFDNLYPFVSQPDFINTKFLGLIELSKKSYLLAALAAVSQYLQISLSIPKTKKINPKNNSLGDNLLQSMNTQLKFMMPLFAFWISLRFFSGVALYWTTMNIFAIVHEMVVRKKAENLLKNEGNSRTNSNYKEDN